MQYFGQFPQTYDEYGLQQELDIDPFQTFLSLNDQQTQQEIDTPLNTNSNQHLLNTKDTQINEKKPSQKRKSILYALVPIWNYKSPLHKPIWFDCGSENIEMRNILMLGKSNEDLQNSFRQMLSNPLYQPRRVTKFHQEQIITIHIDIQSNPAKIKTQTELISLIKSQNSSQAEDVCTSLIEILKTSDQNKEHRRAAMKLYLNPKRERESSSKDISTYPQQFDEKMHQIYPEESSAILSNPMDKQSSFTTTFNSYSSNSITLPPLLPPKNRRTQLQTVIPVQKDDPLTSEGKTKFLHNLFKLHEEKTLKERNALLSTRFVNRYFTFIQKSANFTDFKVKTSCWGISELFSQLMFPVNRGTQDLARFSLEQGLYLPYHDDYSELQHFLSDLLELDFPISIKLRTSDHFVIEASLSISRHHLTTTPLPDTLYFLSDTLRIATYEISLESLQQLEQLRVTPISPSPLDPYEISSIKLIDKFYDSIQNLQNS